MFAHRALLEQDRAVGINPACDQRGGHLANIGAELGGVRVDRQRMKVCEEEQAFRFILHPHPAQDRAQQIAEMEAACRLDSGNDAHQSVTFLRRRRIRIASRSIPPMTQATVK